MCKIRTIVALYQLRGRVGRNDVGIDTEQQKVCIAGERINSGEFVNWLNELVFFYACNTVNGINFNLYFGRKMNTVLTIVNESLVLMILSKVRHCI